LKTSEYLNPVKQQNKNPSRTRYKYCFCSGIWNSLNFVSSSQVGEITFLSEFFSFGLELS